ncbi:hypothetical protein NBRC116583_31350 [Arenicella sp. 4NH20-0111]|uniref:hypothetical protein n=1 Tax=Arenicella sp. 4NH20-0111 TaxID=3127648 RepID=UPI003107F574
MAKIRVISLIFAAFVVVHGTIVTSSGVVGKDASFCNLPLIQAFIPWDSGCYYKALYNTEVTYEQLLYEQARLEIFTEKGGYSPFVRWYRYRVNRQYIEYYKTSFSELDELYWGYLETDPGDLNRYMDHLGYLIHKKHREIAQSSVDKYCTRYASSRTDGFTLFSAITQELRKANIELSLKTCFDSIHPSYRKYIRFETNTQ